MEAHLDCLYLNGRCLTDVSRVLGKLQHILIPSTAPGCVSNLNVRRLVMRAVVQASVPSQVSYTITVLQWSGSAHGGAQRSMTRIDPGILYPVRARTPTRTLPRPMLELCVL
jgi:hypothetical protein